MVKIQDKLTLGVAAGILSNFVVEIIDYVFYLLGVNKWHHFHIAAATYFKLSDANTLPAIIIGAINDFSIAAILGIFIIYILYYTGTDYFYVKGIGVTIVFWLLIYGMLLRFGVSRINPTDPGTNSVHLAVHIILGFLTSWIIVKHGIPHDKKILKEHEIIDDVNNKR